MNGIDLVHEAKTYAPKIKALYTSGYTENAFPDYKLNAGEDIISKPYQKQMLARRIREVLDKRE
jgi:two-component SAPR family response regulator